MLIKLIECDVPPEHRERFSRGQEQWSALSNVDGFLGQIGGWLVQQSDRALIVGYWRDGPAYERFMRDAHDPIVELNEQAGSYSSIQVSLWNQVLDMPGSETHVSSAVGFGGLLRIALCTLKKGRHQHFNHVQETVWNPGMASAGGMLAGVFSRGRSDGDRYLVCTIWKTEADHRHYRENVFPNLRQQAQVELDCSSVEGSLVLVEPTWLVPPPAHS